MGIYENRTLFGGPYNKDPTILGTIFGSPIFGDSQIPTVWFLVGNRVALRATRVGCTILGSPIFGNSQMGVDQNYGPLLETWAIRYIL